MISNWSGSRIKFEYVDLLAIGRENRILPLYSLQAMAIRWGVTLQTVNNWRMRHDDFPREVKGVIVSTKNTPRLYPLFEVERYEKGRMLNK